MTLTVNGERRTFAASLHLDQLISEHLKLNQKGLIAEINGTLYKESDFKNMRLKDGDNVEIIQFMGGG